MDYLSELEFIKNVLRKQRVSVHLLDANNITGDSLDFGLRRISGHELMDMSQFVRSFGDIRERVIYKMMDIFSCSYIMLLMHQADSQILMIGPYTGMQITGEQVMECAARLSVSPRKVKALEECYANIPVLKNDSIIFSMVYSYADLIWGGSGAYELMDLNEVLSEQQTPMDTRQDRAEPEDMVVAMQIMEQRYAWENELMLMVSRGQTSRAEKMLPDMANISFRQRLTDPVRNMKNYCIICNTLMRKAAQQGGVHPMYLDSVSSEYALRIESLTDINSITSLVGEMIRNYCRLVKKHSMKDYSNYVRRAILLIDSQLTEELCLSRISAVLEVNSSYLSTLFKKETGSTITAYITKRRMEQAKNLLRNTGMQVQNVAIYCGIPDANYFSKLFRKETGFSPLEYRNLPRIDL